MASLEEALTQSIDNEPIAPVNDVLVIDPEKRLINVPDSESLFGVFGENIVERKYFTCPRIILNNIDLFNCYIFINYVSASGRIGYIQAADVVLDETGSYIVFSWELTSNVFDRNMDSIIYFSVSAKQYVDDREPVFFTRKAQGKMYETVNGTEIIQEQYADIVLQLLAKMDDIEQIATPEAMQAYVDNWLKENPSAIGGQPVPVESASGMLDTQTLYLYMGKMETVDGVVYEKGYVYYYVADTQSWTKGSPYGDGGKNASDVSYDDTETKLGADNVQEAVNRLLEQTNAQFVQERHKSDKEYAGIIIQTVGGKEIVVTDASSKLLHELKLFGKTEQATTSGAQLFDLASTKGFASLYTGLSTEIDVENNTFTTTNTHTTYMTGFLDLGVLKVGSYYIAFENVNGYTTNPSIYYGELETGVTKLTDISLKGGVFTVTEEAHYWFTWIIRNDNPLKIKNLMLNSGATALPYEPYTGGIPSPNTEFEQPVVHAEKVDVTVQNKNRYNAENVVAYGKVYNANGQLNNNNKFNTYKIDGVKAGEVYIKSCESGSMGSQNTYWYDDTFISSDYHDTKLTIPQGANNVRFAVGLDAISVQVELDTVSTPYVKHESQKVTLTPPREFTKWDKLEKRDGVYGWVYRQLLLTVDGKQWGNYDSRKGFMRKILPEVMVRREGCCNQLRVCSEVISQNGCWLGVSDEYLYVVKSDFYDESLEDKGLANWKAHLNENPLEIWTYTDTAEYIPVSAEEQAMLESLETYYGVTNVTNSEECEMSIQYVADTKLYIDNKFTALATQIV